MEGIIQVTEIMYFCKKNKIKVTFIQDFNCNNQKLPKYCNYIQNTKQVNK